MTLEVHVQLDPVSRVVEFYLINRGPDGVTRGAMVTNRREVFLEPVEEGERIEPMFRMNELYARDFMEALQAAVHPPVPDLRGELAATREALAVERVRVDRVMFPDAPFFPAVPTGVMPS